MYSGSVPSSFAALILTEEQGSTYEEEDEDGIQSFYSNTIDNKAEADKKLQNYLDKGFTSAKLLAYHKYEQISLDKAFKIKGK